MIYEFTDMRTAVQQALLLPNPKQIWVDLDRVVVRTGVDMQKDPEEAAK